MADINGRREGAGPEIDVERALALRSRHLPWRVVGIELAKEAGRRVAFQADGVCKAIRAAGRWDERPK